MPPLHDSHHKVDRLTIARRSIVQHCPNCGTKGLFRDWMRLRYRCTGCGMKLSRSDGFFLGAMVWNYGLTVFGVLGPLATLGLAGLISLETTVMACLIAGVVAPVLFYRVAWGLWLLTYYWVLPWELPANAGDNPDVDEDE